MATNESPEQFKSVGEFLARTAESMTLSGDPKKRAAAEKWIKKIKRELDKTNGRTLAAAA